MSKGIKKSVLFMVTIILLLVCSLLSVSMGSRNIPFHTVLKILLKQETDLTYTAIVRARIPRTIFGILVGASLGVSGSLMQSITRNPIADPSILGVNTGASLFVVIGMAYFGIPSGNRLVFLAFIGAMLTALCVYGIASIGNGGASPMKLVLSGAATSTALAALVSTVMLPDSQVMKAFRFWQVGSISGGGMHEILVLLPYFVTGNVIALMLTSSLNALALGDEMAATLGMNVNRTRFLGALAGILLCASTTALAGPIGFVGLMVPHIVRMLFGADLKITIPISLVFGAILLLLSDVIGRLVIQPSELEVGIVTAVLGAPIFIVIVRKAKIKSL